MPESSTDARDPVSASAEAYKPLSRPPRRLTAGVLVAGAVTLAMLAVLGNYVYEILSYVEIPIEKAHLSTAVSGELKGRRGPDDSGAIGRDGTAGNAPATKVDRGVTSVTAPASTSAAVPADAARTPADPRRASPRATTARTTSERELPLTEPCTEAVAALITHTLYRMMFDGPVPEANASYLSNEEALVKLISDKTVDVVVVAAEQPAPLIANMKPEAQKFIKLLKFDSAHPSSKRPLTVYSQSVVKASSYPNLLQESFTTIAVGAFLVTYDFNRDDTVSNLVRFARSLCQDFATLQAQGHPKWREVDLLLPPLAPGWTYYSPTTREIRACLARKPKAAAIAPTKACSAEERILGLCK